VETAHANGQRVRFWATPEQSPQREAVWQELLAAQVDYINTDHLQALQDFLLRNDPQRSEPYVDWKASAESVRAARAG
jgi:Glycerophosphoryl diester phosphodiesterase family